MTSSSPVRGMRDFLPGEKARRERVLSIIRDTYRMRGFVEVETPFMEDLENLTSDQGGDNEKMLFQVLRRGLTKEDLVAATSPDQVCDLGLRYDLTVGLARYFANNRGQIPDVFRCMHFGPVWRAERPQKGRYRQFTQCDIDIIGESSAIAEIELIKTTMEALGALGLHDLTLKLNDRRLLTALLRQVGAKESEWGRCLISIDKLDKIGLDGVGKELSKTLDGEMVARLLEILTAFDNPQFSTSDFERLVPQAGVPEVLQQVQLVLDTVGDALAPLNVNLRFDGSLVRGMGYYTGMIFEIWHPSSRGAVAGGGRYDDMIGRFLGKPVPSCGFSIGFERIIELIELPADADNDQVAIVYDASAEWADLLAIQAELIASGRVARLVARGRKLSSQLDALVAEGFTGWVNVDADGTRGEIREFGARRAATHEWIEEFPVAVDFDGVLHSYVSGWTGDHAHIPDEPVPGAIEWLNATAAQFPVVVFTTRATTEDGRAAVRAWLERNGFTGDLKDVTALKPPSIFLLDDRAWRFEGPGSFPTAELIRSATPWWHRD